MHARISLLVLLFFIAHGMDMGHSRRHTLRDSYCSLHGLTEVACQAAKHPTTVSTGQQRRGRGKPSGSTCKKWLEEVRFYQNPRSKDLLIGRTAFTRVVHDFVEDLQRERKDLRMTPGALMLLQASSEAMLVAMFSDATFCAVHGQRVTIEPRDTLLVRRLQGLL